MTILHPNKFLEVRVNEIKNNIHISVLCAGYEIGKWRAAQFAKNIIAWMPYAALSQEDQLAFGLHNYQNLIQRAAYHVYTKKGDATRGEIGELLLHQICIEHYKTIPIICKLILKTTPNDVIKGYDGVYILPKKSGTDYEIWLGEAKFYKSGEKAAGAVLKSLKDHFLPDFVNAEKAMIIGHINKDIPFYESLKLIFGNQTSADQMFSKAIFPVLITYDSAALESGKSITADLINKLKLETDMIQSKFAPFLKTNTIQIRLTLIPLSTKKALLQEFDNRIQAYI